MPGPNDAGTPRDLFNACEAKFGPFDLDVCAHRYNHKCEMYFADPFNEYGGCGRLDGLVQPWHKFAKQAWMNPPYTTMKRDKHGNPVTNAQGKAIQSNCIGDWCQKAVDEVKHGVTTVALLKCDFSTTWFRDIVRVNAYSIHILLAPRVRFEELVNVDGALRMRPMSTPNFSPMIVLFKPDPPKHRVMEFWDWMGRKKAA